MKIFMAKLDNPEPLMILEEEYLKPIGMTASELSSYIFDSLGAISPAMGHLIGYPLKGQAPFNIILDECLSKVLGTSVGFWMGLYHDWARDCLTPNYKKQLKRLKPLRLYCRCNDEVGVLNDY